ncbi:Helix-turn-helix domain-containing protein [Halopelagius inordinatus]|uniref:Helix-turn-helix domain-containing protein n=1 Tax=Halopelagius inordinatus TaxID=553467 RepID=A0A1I2NM34_9EURY|nr:helix-turn-helix domain-containing protein [Halopelagius inordinatus]SFG02757.1 Helix-turn-helix domain-containing protein [Halopelagius inordinatus]
MAREQSAAEPTELGSILDALDDADARDIIRTLDEPMTASEISDTCEIPLSTTYRKLDLLTDADLLLEGTEIRSDGHHATTYEVAFEEVKILLTEERRLSVDIARTERSPDKNLADIWTAVRKET